MFRQPAGSTWNRTLTLPPVLKRYFFKRTSAVIIQDFQDKFTICKSFAHKFHTERHGLIFYVDTSTSPSIFEFRADRRHLERRITIRDLRLDTVHTGCYLLCRVFSGSYHLTTVNTLVIDPEESIEHVSVEVSNDSSFADNLSNRACAPKGALLVIRNPFYTTGADGKTFISIKNRNELFLVSEHDGLAAGVTWVQNKYPPASVKAHHRQQKMELRYQNLPEIRNQEKRRTPRWHGQKPDVNAKLGTDVVLYSSPGSPKRQQTGYHYDGTPKARSSLQQAVGKPLNPLLQRTGRKKPSRKNLNVRFEQDGHENGPWQQQRPCNHGTMDTDTAVLLCCLAFFVWLFFYASYFM